MNHKILESEISEKLTDVLRENHYSFEPLIIHQFVNYLLLLKQWNKIHNLTSIDDVNKMLYLHILDSLSIAPFLQNAQRIIDVGTGAGLPGIPLSIIDPAIQWTLLDANQKKIHFLNQVKLDLKLSNIEVIKSRVEEYHPQQCFDKIVTRAFSSLLTMITNTEHLLCPNGEFLAMKGTYPDTELKAIPTRFDVEVIDLNIQGLEQERCLVKIKRRLNG